MVVENKYNKYRIEDLKKINSRYYQITMHGKMYVIDYFDGFDFRNYFPFKVFYQGRPKKWNIYEISEKKYKAKPVSWTGQFPGVFKILGLYPIYILVAGSFFSDKKILEGMLLTILFLLINFILLRYIKKKESLDINEKDKLFLVPVENKKNKNKFIKFKQILVISLFIFLIAISSTQISYILFLPSLAVAVGNMGDNEICVPDQTIKYKIIEKEEN